MKRCFLVFIILALSFELIGCDAFVRKFTRKPKTDENAVPDLVLVPEEYKSNMSKEDLYHKYFSYWQAWHEELMQALYLNLSLKKRVDCSEQAIKNLISLKGLLTVEKQKALDIYINDMKELRDSISSDTYNTDHSLNMSAARRLKLNILKDFSYPQVKKDLI